MLKQIFKKLGLACIALTIISSSTGFAISKANAGNNASSALMPASSIVESKLDSKLLKDDFYLAVNKDWISKNPIQKNEMSVSDFSKMQEVANKETENIVNHLLKTKDSLPKNSVERKIVDFYESCLDIEGRNKNGAKPIETYLNDIKSVKTINDLNRVLSNPKLSIFNTLFRVNVSQDYDTSKFIVYIAESKLHLNDPSYYNTNKETEKGKRNRTAFSNYANKLLTLSGYSAEEAKVKVDNILKLESQLSTEISWNGIVPDNVNSPKYNPYTLKEIDKLAPNLNLASYIESLGYDISNKFIVEDPSFMKKLNQLYTDENIQLFKDYLELEVIESSASLLSEDFSKANENFGYEAYGFKPMDNFKNSAKDRALSMIDFIFSDAINMLYVEKNFSAEDKANVESITKNIIESYKELINSNNTLSIETKKNLLDRLDKMKIEIGYPDKWKDYKNLEIKSIKDGGTLAENYNSYLYTYLEESKNLLKSGRDNFLLDSPISSIYYQYNKATNSLSFSAIVLQKPFYDKNKSREENLGNIGAKIAHEISHVLDTTDENGNTTNVWLKDDIKKFEKDYKKIKSFYSKIEILPKEFVNGEVTLNENIADISAMQCLLNILNKTSTSNYKKFFESYAESLRININNEVLKEGLKYDPYSPDKVRVNATLQQFKRFYQTYGIKEGDKMYVSPKYRLKIW